MQRTRILLFASMLLIGLTVRVDAQDRPEYTIYRTGIPIVVDGRLDEPAWISAPSVGKFVFSRYESGEKEQTVAKVLWNNTHLYVAFICEDAHIWAEHTLRDSKVWLDDTVEVFTSPNPDQPQTYYNIEMNVLGIFLDQYHPKGPEGPVDDGWKGKGIKIKTTISGTLNNDTDKDKYWILEAAIPFTNFAEVAKHTPPKSGEVWFLNLNRLGGNTNQQHSQWSVTMPSFHVPSGFGRVIFSDKISPFWR